jgi:Flp pilus assembly protein TadD/polyferredoxin
MYTLELGIITAGFLFMLVAAVSVVFFGRFFCSWGCHILALEDLANWLLNKVGIKPKPVRSRALLFVPPVALAYMFVWPQILRISEGRAFPPMRVFTDLDGWGSFVTNNFWRNLPGPWIIAFTFLFCGFAIVYVLGSRSFCRYACPYGAVFGLLDRVAPGQIKAGDNCEQCGRCTEACTSNIQVHQELNEYGRVVSSACLKDLDCVSVCPHEAVHFGFGKPSGFRSWWAARKFVKYDFSLGEDLLMAATFVATLLIFRGLYGAVPFLMMLGLSGILAYLAVVCVRLVRSPVVGFANLQLKLGGRLTTAGRVFAIFALVTVGLVAHCAFIRYHEFSGERAYQQVVRAVRSDSTSAPSAVINDAIVHLKTTERWGLFRHSLTDRRLATLHLLAGDREQAGLYLERIREREPSEAHELVAEFSTHDGDVDGAISAYREAIRSDPDRVAPRLALAALLAERGQYAEAATHYMAAAELEPESARIHYNLAVMMAELGRLDEAIRSYRVASGITPNDPEIHNNLGSLLARRGEREAAEEHLRIAIRLSPDYSHPHYNLGRLLTEQGRTEEGREHLARAAALDPRYAEIVDR